jgi:hypothetical protein
MWQALGSNSSDPLFALTVATGSVIDIEGVYTLTNDYIAPNSSITTGTAGMAYYLALDGPVSHKLVPQGLPTTN